MLQAYVWLSLTGSCTTCEIDGWHHRVVRSDHFLNFTTGETPFAVLASQSSSRAADLDAAVQVLRQLRHVPAHQHT